mmetsp:Transcript_28072/g.64835  ORF Transcript_28072/g.64835 Transcript_28072/m.64835 type:complete len:541 (-) Transcript_28072:16-1638(-)
MGCSTSLDFNFHESYAVGAKVWQGGYAQVRVAKERYGIDDFAARIIDLRERVDKNTLEDRPGTKRSKQVAEEVAIWRSLGKHENIVQLREVFREDWLCYVLTEHCEFTFLYVLERLSSLHELVLGRFFRDALRGLMHMHGLEIIHGDIKPDNFMVTGGNTQVLKLTGFDSAGKVLQSGSYRGERRGTTGTSAFSSPEMLGTKRYEYKTDVWSLGVVAYVLFFGCFPYKSEENVKSGKPDIAYQPWRVSRKNTKLSAEALAFSKDVLNRYPLKRPSAEKALELKFLTTLDSTDVPTNDDGQVQTLLPNLCGAIRAGAFGRLVAPEADDVDHILNYYQYKHHGPITPWTKQRQLGSLLYTAMEKSKKDDKMVPDVSMILGKLQRQKEVNGERTMLSGPAMQSVDASNFLRRVEDHGGMRPELSGRMRPDDSYHSLASRMQKDDSLLSGGTDPSLAQMERRESTGSRSTLGSGAVAGGTIDDMGLRGKQPRNRLGAQHPHASVDPGNCTSPPPNGGPGDPSSPTSLATPSQLDLALSPPRHAS